MGLYSDERYAIVKQCEKFHVIRISTGTVNFSTSNETKAIEAKNTLNDLARPKTLNEIAGYEIDNKGC